MKRPRLGPNVWVVRHGRHFSVLEERSAHCLLPSVFQHTAIPIARCMARANRSELIVQGRHGRIRFRNSYGPDPRQTRG